MLLLYNDNQGWKSIVKK